MNLIGHNYIAKKVLSKYNPLIAAGAHIPDEVEFVSSSVFSYGGLHENPDAVFEYTTKQDRKYLGLALGMMAHSVKYGADKYTGDIEKWLFKGDESLRNTIADKIVQASGISIEIAKGPRMHNYLWGGLDFYLIDKYPEFVDEIKENYKAIDTDQVSEILAQAYDKNLDKVKANIEKHIGLVNKYDISTKLGFVKFWKDFVSELPEKDNVDVDKAVFCINFIENIFEKDWEEVINRVVKDIKLRMSTFTQD
jgi:hypothetical protein